MFSKYSNWYKSLHPLKQLTVFFTINWFYWLLAWVIAEKFFLNEQHSWVWHIFHAVWMAFFWTIIFNWKKSKSLFKRNHQS